MNHRIVAALVVVLLVVSCTSDQPDDIGQGGAGRAVDPQLRAQRPPDKISTRLQRYCPRSAICGIQYQVLFPRETEALVSQLRLEEPSWLRYVKAIQIRSLSPQHEAEHDRQVDVQTSIFVNDAGKDLGAAICLALLEKKFDGGVVWGVSPTMPFPRPPWGTPLLAEC